MCRVKLDGRREIPRRRLVILRILLQCGEAKTRLEGARLRLGRLARRRTRHGHIAQRQIGIGQREPHGTIARVLFGGLGQRQDRLLRLIVGEREQAQQVPPCGLLRGYPRHRKCDRARLIVLFQANVALRRAQSRIAGKPVQRQCLVEARQRILVPAEALICETRLHPHSRIIGRHFARLFDLREPLVHRAELQIRLPQQEMRRCRARIELQ